MELQRYHKVGIAGVCMFIFSLIYQNAILPPMVIKNMKKVVALKQGLPMRDFWGKYPMAIEFNAYIFNVTNPEEVKQGTMPKLEQIGPFVYDKWQEKCNQEDHEEDDTVSFNFRYKYAFNAEKSYPLTGEEIVTIPDVLLMGLINGVLRERPPALPIVVRAIDSIFKKPNESFFREKVRTIFFDGISFDCNVNDFPGQAVCNEIFENYKSMGLVSLGDRIYSVSAFGSLNGSVSLQRYRVHRGVTDVMKVGKLKEFNGKQNMSFWKLDECNQFHGTDGTIFHPFMDKKGKETILSFYANMCRDLVLHFDSKSTFEGFKTLRYTTSLGADPINNPTDRCYCEDANLDNCPLPGVIDLYDCLRRPIFYSSPHFYQADPALVRGVDGLHPDKEKHMTFFDFDPFTGIPLQSHFRIQLNMMLRKVEKFRLYQNFFTALLPIFWVDERKVLPDFRLKEIRQARKFRKMGKIFQHIFMFGGLMMIAFAVFMHIKFKKTEEKEISVKESKPNSGEKKIPMTVNTSPAPAIPMNID